VGAGLNVRAAPRLLAAGGLVLALAAAGCGPDEPGRSELAERLAAMCEEAREDIEALGLPSERGIAVIRPWANRGTRLAVELQGLPGGMPAERRRLRSLGTALEEFYAGLRLGHTIYTQTKSLDAYAATIDRAKAFQAEADEIATGLGVPECTVRPFDEE
jgi:hypothetical protein